MFIDTLAAGCCHFKRKEALQCREQALWLIEWYGPWCIPPVTGPEPKACILMSRGGSAKERWLCRRSWFQFSLSPGKRISASKPGKWTDSFSCALPRHLSSSYLLSLLPARSVGLPPPLLLGLLALLKERSLVEGDPPACGTARGQEPLTLCIAVAGTRHAVGVVHLDGDL